VDLAPSFRVFDLTLLANKGNGMKNAAQQAVLGWCGLAGIGLRTAKDAKHRGRKNVQKKFEKLLTGLWCFAILGAHTVNT
jgi:hypothetical protein